jgi:hypothetical protein
MKLTVHARRDRLLLAEEAALLAISDGEIIADGHEARTLLGTPASHDLAEVARARFLRAARDELSAMLEGPIAKHAERRAAELLEDHARLRAAAGAAPRVTVEAVLPPDVIGLFVLLPAGA